MKNLKQLNELIQGKCKVVCKDTLGKTKIIESATYDAKLNLVFLACPFEWEVLGYLQ